MNRRKFLAGGLIAAAGNVGHSPCVEATPTCAQPRAFLFIHGAWHSAAHWNRVVALLAQIGHRALAVDLPGSGLNARYPRSYVRNDWISFLDEVSPVKDITLDTYADAVTPIVERLAASGAQVTLVGHSFGGMTITAVAERVPQAVHRLVYVTAFCASAQAPGSVAQYNGLPENARSLSGAVLLGDPAKTGALRLNPRSADAAYLEKGRQAFYNDVPFEDFLRYAACLNPDLSLKAVSQDGRGTLARWGRIPRTFIRCTEDNAIPLALQDRMIREADALTPRNRFRVETLPSSHSPFASMPEKLARILGDLP